MTSKTVRLNDRESAIIYTALCDYLEWYKDHLKGLIEMDPEALAPNIRADRDMLITSYQARINATENLLKKI